MSILFDGVYENPTTPWWSTGIANPANIEASTITVNAEPAGNILLTSVISSTTQFNAPLIFQRPAADPNAPSESLVMNLSDNVPTKLVNGEYISATKASGTAYDDIAVAGLQVYGDQTTSGNSGAHAYITGEGGNLILAPKNSVYISSLQVSSLQVVNVISTTAGVANSYKANLWMSTPILVSDSISTSQISTNTIKAVTANISTINVSTLNAPNFAVSTVSSIIVDTKVTLTSTLSLTGSPTNVNLGLGNVIQGLVGGAATQALGVGIGTAALVTGSVALVTGRTSGGVNSNVFQTVNGSTQLQFSTIGSAVSSIFLTVNSPNPLTTPGLEISTTQGVAAGTYCVRSVGDPLYITNNVSSIQMYGQWVPVIQPTATIPTVAISSLGVSSINGATYPPPGGGGIPSTLAASTITINGALTQSGTGTFNWGGNTMSPTQVVLSQPTSVNNTLTTTGTAFLNAGATVNGASLTVGAGTPLIVNNTARINNLSTVFMSTANINLSSVNGLIYPPPVGTPTIPSTIALSTVTVNGGQNISNGGLSVSGGATVFAGLNVASGGATIASGMTVTSGNVTVNNSLFTLGILQGATIQATGSLSVGSSGISIVGTGITMAAGNLNMTNGASVANITNVNVNQTVNANLLRAAAISTNSISTNNINLLTINNASYPPPPGPTVIPSTINASTINFDGGLNNIGSAAINAGNLNANSITTTNANVNFYNGNAITAASISTISISTGSVQSLTSVISSFIVSSINNASYPPPAGLASIPSTLNASTINVNGGINISNGGIINNSFDPIRTEFLSTNFLSTGLITADSLNVSFQSTNTIRAAAISTTFLSSQTITASNVGCFQFSSLTGSIKSLFVEGGAPNSGIQFNDGGNVGGSMEAIGGTLTTYIDPTTSGFHIQNGYSFGTNRILTCFGQTSASPGTAQFFSTLTVCANPDTSPVEACIQTYPPSAPNPVGTIISKAVSTQSILVSSINGVQIPGSLGVPIGSITIWAGGTDNNLSSQNFNIPVGWLICDGSYILNSVFPTLVSILGSKYGYAGQSAPPGTTALPDLTFAVPMGTPYRNYTNSIIPTLPSFSMQCKTSDSAYNTTSLTGGGTQISSLTTWYITSKIGPALNYGSLIPGNAVTVAGSSVTFPNMYISSIIQYEGAANDTGFIVLRSIDGTPIPRIPTTSTIGAVGQGTTGTVPGGDAPFFLGSPNLDGNRYTTRNQKGIEVGAHNHKGTADFNILGSVALPNTACGTGGYTQANFQPYVSTLQSQNAAMPTAPNFLNMSYIIRAL